MLPLIFTEGRNAEKLGLDGSETYFIEGMEGMHPRKTLQVRALREDGSDVRFPAVARLDTDVDVAYFAHGGILQYVLRKIIGE